MAVEAASLFVKVTGDISDASKKMGQVGGIAQKTGGIMRGALSTAIGFGAMTIGLQAVGGMFGNIKDGVIGMNAELETSTLQFTTLMGDADKAKKHVEGLFDFAAKTPFETGPILKASRTMETFGGAALNSNKNLLTFGNAAAAVSQPIDDVAFWMSRAYAAIQGGQPFGEARMRLMEMGILTPKVSKQLEDMSNAGADTTKTWGVLTGSLGKFDGAMEKQSQTFDGMMSTFTDGVAMALAKGGKPLFEMLKGLLGGVNSLMSSPAFQGAMEAAANGLAKGFGLVAKAGGAIIDFATPIVKAIGSLFSLFQSGDSTTASLGTTLSGLADTALASLASVGETIWASVNSWLTNIAPQLLSMATKISGFVLDAIPGLVSNLGTMAQSLLDWIMNTGVPGLAAAMGPMAEAAIGWVTGTAIPKLGEVLPKVASTILDFVVQNVPKIIGKLAEWGKSFVGWIGPQVPKIIGALVGLLGSLGGWILNTALPKIVGLAGDLGAGLLAGFLQFVIGPPGLLEKISTFITGTLIPGIKKYGPGLLSAAGEIAGKFVTGFIDFMGSLPGKVAAQIRKAFGSLRINIGPFHISASGVTIDLPQIKLPGFAEGSWSVPMTGPALIHKGEMVIPADLASRLRGGGGIGGGGGGLGRAAGGGGGISIVVNIGDFHGTEDGIRSLSRSLGQYVRNATVASYSAGRG